MAQAAAAEPGAAGASLESAHKAVLDRKDLQFTFDDAPLRRPAESPDWLRALFEWLQSVLSLPAELVRVLFWVLVIAAAGAVLFLILREVGALEFSALRKKRAAPAEPLYRPDVETAKALLADADALAAEGRYEEAVHVLLLRSVEDMRRWRPKSVQPSFTSRDLAGLPSLPEAARAAFSAMARLVETSLFGGRPVGAEGFAASRKAYADFALPGVWS